MIQIISSSFLQQNDLLENAEWIKDQMEIVFKDNNVLLGESHTFLAELLRKSKDGQNKSKRTCEKKGNKSNKTIMISKSVTYLKVRQYHLNLVIIRR